MTTFNITNSVASDMTNAFTATAVTPLNTEGVTGGKTTEYTNNMWSTYWAYFNEHPELKSAMLMKVIWDVGKGWTADPETTVILNHITGMGKDSFDDILFNMDLCRYVGRDSFAEIIRDKESDTLLNLKILDPSSIKIVLDENGILKHYEQVNKTSGKGTIIFQPKDIFHLTCDRLADQIHGISKIESLGTTLLADIESFNDGRKVMHQQARPFIIFKWKTDDLAKITTMKARIDTLRNLGEDLHIPDDNNDIAHEVVQVNPSSAFLAWRQDVINRIYRALGMPLVLFGAQGSTESGGKMEYLGHEQVFEYGQRYLERQVLKQLRQKIDLVSPISMAQNLMSDESKDQSASGMPQGLEQQPQDVTAGAG